MRAGSARQSTRHSERANKRPSYRYVRGGVRRPFLETYLITPDRFIGPLTLLSPSLIMLTHDLRASYQNEFTHNVWKIFAALDIALRFKRGHTILRTRRI